MDQWKDIQGYEGLYQISNEGSIKSLKYGKERILKPQTNDHGYLFVNLYKECKMKSHKVHRLVANAFINNPKGLNEVNHIDEDKTNNCTTNLEWCLHKDNCNYGTRNQRMAETLTNRTDLSIPVDMLTKDGEPIRTFQSSREAERWLRDNGFPKAAQTHIIQCCKGKVYKSCYGFKWRYAQVN